ncbi:MAG: prepilin-type N-terminal cleavage/methylation domain-containing protein [Humidesulfovibrio sp.]|nr:prepilin-type N-terminal cleavage/methylation domain-containing protein [Humidesulfovibrio sp.]
MPTQRKRQRGFTLIEVIVIILVAGFLGALIVNFLGTQLLKSSSPVTTTQNAAQAEAIMEQVVSYFTDNVNQNTSGTLNQVVTEFGGNNTAVQLTRNANTFSGDGQDSLTVVVTVGGVSFTTLLTQERTNSTDAKVSF